MLPVPCFFCDERVATMEGLAYHLIAQHLLCIRRHWLQFDYFALRDRVDCWCGLQFPLDAWGGHLEFHGGLEQHLTEHLFGVGR